MISLNCRGYFGVVLVDQFRYLLPWIHTGGSFADSLSFVIGYLLNSINVKGDLWLSVSNDNETKYVRVVVIVIYTKGIIKLNHIFSTKGDFFAFVTVLNQLVLCSLVF